MTASDFIRIRRYGARGPTVLVLHGGPGAPGSACQLAQALAANCRVLEPLQRRAGRVPLTVDRHVEDLAAVAPARAAVVGWSWGAMLGLSYAARFPARVSALALVGCGTYDEPSRALYQQAVARCLGEAAAQQVEALRRQLAETQDPALRNAIRGQLGAIYMNAETVDPLEDIAPCAEDLPVDDAGNRETWEDVLRLQREGIEPAGFRSISARVIMLHGDSDPHPGPSTRDVLRQFVPQLEYIEFAQCGHQPWLERAAREPFLAHLRRWLAHA